MDFLYLRSEPGIHSRVTAGVALNNFGFSATSGLLSCSDGHLRSLNEAWQKNTEASGGEAGDRRSRSSWYSDIGIPINFQ